MKKLLPIWLSVRAKGKLAIEATHGFLLGSRKRFRRVSLIFPSLLAFVQQLKWPKYNQTKSIVVEQPRSVDSCRVYLMQTHTNSREEGTMYDYFGVQEGGTEDVYQTVRNVAKKPEIKYPEQTSASVTECAADVRPGQDRPLITKFVRRQSNLAWWLNLR